MARWSPRATLAFTIAVSFALWGCIGVAIVRANPTEAEVCSANTGGCRPVVDLWTDVQAYPTFMVAGVDAHGVLRTMQVDGKGRLICSPFHGRRHPSSRWLRAWDRTHLPYYAGPMFQVDGDGRVICHTDTKP